MTGNQPKHCDLCDLPLTQCAHGLARRQAGAARRRAAKRQAGTPAPGAAEPPAGKEANRRGRQSAATSKTVGEGVRACAECGQRARYGRYRLCLPCGIRAGFRLCARCGRYFQPETPIEAKKKAVCNPCKGKRGGSVWVVASAGAPGLGRRS